MRTPILLDGRNFLDRTALNQAGFRYLGLGW
jgi:UDPglucose 6-dehydrogenase